MTDERPAKRVSGWSVGFHLTFLVYHWLDNQGMPRRYADYLPTDDFTLMHRISRIDAFLLGYATVPRSSHRGDDDVILALRMP